MLPELVTWGGAAFRSLGFPTCPMGIVPACVTSSVESRVESLLERCSKFSVPMGAGEQGSLVTMAGCGWPLAAREAPRSSLSSSVITRLAGGNSASSEMTPLWVAPWMGVAFGAPISGEGQLVCVSFSLSCWTETPTKGQGWACSPHVPDDFAGPWWTAAQALLKGMRFYL